ncbi:hypothetical protein JTB14_006465 [Gonioctena quinquepunctata]|nr:hypothetical protein JTB14_006465 [Gonioctena quinquepunctata]
MMANNLFRQPKKASEYCVVCSHNSKKNPQYSYFRFPKDEARGIQAECKQKLERVVHHISSKSHTEAGKAKLSEEQWNSQSENHPWLRTLKSFRSQVVKQLIQLCVDVYNDSFLETDIDVADVGTKYADKLRKLIVCTKGTLQKLLASLFVISPHSMTTERVISHYNNMKIPSRMSSNEDTLNDRLKVALNGQGTAYFDPRPAIVEFFRRKYRRYREATPENYRNRDFIKKFVKKETEFDI